MIFFRSATGRTLCTDRYSLEDFTDVVKYMAYAPGYEVVSNPPKCEGLEFRVSTKYVQEWWEWIPS